MSHPLYFLPVVLLNSLLEEMVHNGGSDLHLKMGRPPLMRLDGSLDPMERERLGKEDVMGFIDTLLNEDQKAKLFKNLGIDVAYAIPGLARFRANILFQRGTPAIIMRTIPFQIPKLADLRLPAVLNQIIDIPQGLILVTGPTGSGKSTTIAAMIQHFNENERFQIITIEDPIEFLFRDDKSSIMQREVGTDIHNFGDGLKGVFRQDPDVIVIGEMRDFETMHTAITAAETGHIVLSTLHTNDASQTIDRVLDSFPIDQQHQLRIQLSMTLRAIVSQRLVRTRDGHGRVACVEVLINSPHVAEMIVQEKTSEIYEAMRTSVEGYGMQTLEQSLVALCVNGVIDYKEGLTVTSRTSELERAIRELDSEQF